MLYHATARIDQELQSKTAEASVVPRGTTTQIQIRGADICCIIVVVKTKKTAPIEDRGQTGRDTILANANPNPNS